MSHVTVICSHRLLPLGLNILLDAGRNAKLADFGLAREIKVHFTRKKLKISQTMGSVNLNNHDTFYYLISFIFLTGQSFKIFPNSVVLLIVK